MRNFVIRVIINAIAIAITASLLPGITVLNNDIGTLLILGFIFGIVNAFIKPLLMFLTCPAVLLTLGLFILVINGFMLQIAAWFAGDRLIVDGFGAALIGGIVMSIITMIFEGFMRLDDDSVKVEHERGIPRR
jgi:putative membrane protein